MKLQSGEFYAAGMGKLPRIPFDLANRPGEVGLLLGIRGGGVPPGSSNPDPMSDQNMFFFFHTRFQT